MMGTLAILPLLLLLVRFIFFLNGSGHSSRSKDYEPITQIQTQGRSFKPLFARSSRLRATVDSEEQPSLFLSIVTWN